MVVTVFFSSVSCSTELKKRQDRVMSVLSSKKIPFETVDISQTSEDRALMRERAGDSAALAPQICNGEVYCGDFVAFEEAIEMGELEKFLKI